MKELGQQIDQDRRSLDNGNAALVRAFNERVGAFNKELDAAKEEAGYWSIFNVNRLIERMRRLLGGAREG